MPLRQGKGRMPLAALCLLLVVSGVRAEAREAPLTVYVFYGADCPHCEAQKPFLAQLAQEHAALRLQYFEVSRSREHHALFKAMAGAHDIRGDLVPSVFAGGTAWVGDSPATRRALRVHVAHCLQAGCPDSLSLAESGQQAPPPDGISELTLPGGGRVDIAQQPLLLSTALIAFVDGFNPCSVWVLTILLALVIHSGSRRRVAVVGTVYLLVTAGIYALFIAGVFGALSVAIYSDWVRWLVALLAMVFALVNIKDYFWFRSGPSFSIDARHKPGMFRRMRALVAGGRSLPALVAATAVMAAGVSLIELPCTAGFPVIWSGLLAQRDVDLPGFALLLALYLLIYLLDELAIFAVALVTLRMQRFEARHGRLLKLFGGVVMLTLALVLLLAPGLMQDGRIALGVFAAAFALCAAIVLVHRGVLARRGIRRGDGG